MVDENQTETKKFEYQGQLVSPDEVDKEQEEAKKAMQAKSKWRIIEDGKTAQLPITGNIYKRDAQFEGGTTTKYEFELAQQTPDGEYKVFSTGNKSQVCRDLVKLIKQYKPTREKPLMTFVTRSGVGKNTTYKVSIPE